MPLPPDLQLSQGSLQDFVDCRRRFQLRYVLRRAWPAIAAEPALENERHLRLGELFHRLVQQHAVGVPVERLSRMAVDDDVSRWWRHYLDSSPANLLGAHYHELALSAPLGEFRLVGTYDLVVITPQGRAIIYDWKTSRRRPSRGWLAARLQTLVYPYLLVEASSELRPGQGIAPDQVEMVYWFADFPDQPERFAYSVEQHRENGVRLAALVQEAMELSEVGGDWPLTPVEEHCRFCVYRSLCNRGVRAGEVDEAEEAAGEPLAVVDVDFEQIAEIEY